ncbi:MAG: hypothetical protein JNM78_05790 [Cyclobacteriaceae bacterium]|nr:hypothetical protein [Cyclobacteriaceae bacterium]
METLFFLLVLPLFALLGYQLFKKRKIDQKQHIELHDVFDRHPIKSPILEIQEITMLPTFTVTFFDESDYEYAKNNGLFERFNNRIKNKFFDTEFPVEHAITYRWIK